MTVEIMHNQGLEGIYCLLVKENISFQEWVGDGTSKPWNSYAGKVIILWQGHPINPMNVLGWRSALIEEEYVRAFRILIAPENEPEFGWKNWMEEKLGSWISNKEDNVDKGLEKGTYIKFIEEQFHDLSFLTISPDGKFVDVLDKLDRCKGEYRNIIGHKVGVRREMIHDSIDKLLKLDPKQDNYKSLSIEKFSELNKKLKDNNFSRIDPNTLPKILILGESGVGKTMVAKYLAWRTSPDDDKTKLYRPLKRVPLPEYLGREDHFEYDVFGFMRGAYTSAPESGNKGFLLQYLGGIIFFDEIGDASPAMQAKLLAFLDDYIVVPRGWSGEGIFCPVSIVAATNQPIEKLVKEGTYRNDLLQRFNVIINIPSLNDRNEELPFIIDSLLHQKAVDINQRIKGVSSKALEYLVKFDYKDKNFRILIKMLNEGCYRAWTDGRNYLDEADIPKDTTLF